MRSVHVHVQHVQLNKRLQVFNALMLAPVHCCLLTWQSIEVLAEVVAVTLELSCEELMFSFSLDNWDNYVEQVSAHRYSHLCVYTHVLTLL